jgi:hypothetical protein
VPFDGWDAFSKTVLDAAVRAPAVILPQLVWFFVSYDESFESTEQGLVQKWVFDEGVADRLFGIIALAEVFACKDEAFGEMASESIDEVRFVKSQLATILKRRMHELAAPSPEVTVD